MQDNFTAIMVSFFPHKHRNNTNAIRYTLKPLSKHKTVQNHSPTLRFLARFQAMRSEENESE